MIFFWDQQSVTNCSQLQTPSEVSKARLGLQSLSVTCNEFIKSIAVRVFLLYRKSSLLLLNADKVGLASVLSVWEASAGFALVVGLLWWFDHNRLCARARWWNTDLATVPKKCIPRTDKVVTHWGGRHGAQEQQGQWNLHPMLQMLCKYAGPDVGAGMCTGPPKYWKLRLITAFINILG